MVRYRLDPNNPRRLTPEEAQRLEATPIDCSDIPPLTEGFFSKGRTMTGDDDFSAAKEPTNEDELYYLIYHSHVRAGRMRLFETWRDFVAHDPEAGSPFASCRDVPDFALDMVESAEGLAECAAMSGSGWNIVGFYVEPDELARYVARFRVPEDRLSLPADEPPNTLRPATPPLRPPQSAPRWRQLALFD